jgi:hypothetical protein
MSSGFVERADLRDDRVFHLVFITLLGADPVLPQTQVGVRIDHSWNHHFAFQIPYFRVPWDAHVSADLGNRRVLNQQRAVFDVAFGCGHQSRTRQC